MNDVYSPSGNGVRSAVVELLKILVAMAEVEYPEPDWMDAPPEANWWAIHADGVAAWFFNKPHPYAAIWLDEIDEVGYTYDGPELPLGCDWRLTLRQRPSRPTS